jgi:NADH:ubiquinone oxidoreductase subunit F (NADH-binding)
VAGKDFGLKVFKKPDGYISGEETTILNNIEGKIKEPRLKPPYPTEVGLFGCPTLINNVETFYYIFKISRGEYKNTRFFCISGDTRKKGVFELADNLTIRQILKETNNLPDSDFFVQVGGGAAGEILLPNELDKPVCGMGSIIIFDKQKTDLYLLMKKWADFFITGNCDKCTPCREGVYRIREILKDKKIDKEVLQDICLVLDKTSFCPLGKSVSRPFSSLISKLL